jgi:hypothetical protein
MNSEKARLYSSPHERVRRDWLLMSQGCSLQIGIEFLRLVFAVRVPGVLLDAELVMKPHIAKTVAICVIITCAASVRFDAMLAKTLLFASFLALVTSRLDCCNSSLASHSTFCNGNKTERLGSVFGVGIFFHPIFVGKLLAESLGLYGDES